MDEINDECAKNVQYAILVLSGIETEYKCYQTHYGCDYKYRNIKDSAYLWYWVESEINKNYIDAAIHLIRWFKRYG